MCENGQRIREQRQWWSRKTNRFRTNKQMKLIYPWNGLLDDEFWAFTEKLMNCVSTFTSAGSGWRFEGLQSLKLNFARFAPIWPGSCIVLPPKYESKQSCLIFATTTTRTAFSTVSQQHITYTMGTHCLDRRHPLVWKEPRVVRTQQHDCV